MRGLVKLIYRFHVFLVFLVLSGLAFTFLVRYNQPHSSAFLNATSGISMGIYKQQARVQQLLKLQEANDSLSLELALMKSKESDFYQFVGADFQEREDSTKQQHYRFTSARVVNNSVNRASNYITINKGTANGIRPEMAATSGNAVVGLVKDVSENFATIMPLINSNSKLSVKLKDVGDFGYVRWDVRSPFQGLVQDIPKQALVQIGDTLVTTGNSAYFPPNLFVGTVAEAEVGEGDSFYSITIDFAADFTRLQYVDVIENLLQEEQRTLEAKQEDNG